MKMAPLLVRAIAYVSLLLCQLALDVTAASADQPDRPASLPLSLDDVSILFPVPAHVGDLDRLIAVKELVGSAANAATPSPVFPPDFFGQLIATTDSPAGTLAGTTNKLSLPAELRNLDVWFVAGIRVDAGAPGLSSHIIDQYGQAPQIRLILQPITKAANGSLVIRDTAVHLIFNLTDAGGLPPAEEHCFPRLKPDLELFSRLVSDVAVVRDQLANGQFGKAIKTAGRPLGVHPGLADAGTAKRFRDAVKSLLGHYLTADRLQAMAIMAIPDGAPEPWMFLSFVRVPPHQVPQLPQGGFVPVHGPLLDGNQFVEALSFSSGDQHVLPMPQNDNLNPITCKNEATIPPTLPAADRKGLATAELFKDPPPPSARVEEVTNLVADPTKSHFFNTDCISCHTETRRAMDLAHTKTFDHVDTAVLPQEKWNVRNFGWFPSFFRQGHIEATVTRRTANETQAVIDFINSTILKR